MCIERNSEIFGWRISNRIGAEVIVFERENMGRSVIISEMKVVAKIAFVDDLVNVQSIEGYVVQISYEEKSISILNA